MITNMKYGAFEFETQPIPFVTINKDYIKSPNQINVTANVNVTLNGRVVAATGRAEVGIVDVDAEMDVLRNAFNEDGLLFTILTSGTSETVFFSGYPRIQSIVFSPSPDNWTHTAPYIINLQFDTTDPTEDSTLLPPYLQDVNESWTIEPFENHSFDWTIQDGRSDSCPYQLRVNHEVAAVGKSAYDAGGLIKPAWEWARGYVTGLLGYDDTMVSQQGVVTFEANKYDQFNHNRITNIDETAGSFSVSENWLVVETGVGTSGLPANAIEDFTIDIKQNTSDDITSVSIAGEIIGLASISLTGGAIATTGVDGAITQNKYVAASGYWNEIKNRLLPRIQVVSSGTANRNFHPLAVNTRVDHHPCEGFINYSYEYNDRVVTCTKEALQETIEIIDDNPLDVFATLDILGRSVGPILQDMSTVTAPSRTVIIDIIIEPATGWPSGTEVLNWFSQRPTGVNELITDLKADLSDNNSQVFVSSDVEEWQATEGNYTRTVTWTYMNCT